MEFEIDIPANPQTRKPANPQTRKPANPQTRKPANPQTRKPRNPETQKPRNIFREMTFNSTKFISKCLYRKIFARNRRTSACRSGLVDSQKSICAGSSLYWKHAMTFHSTSQNALLNGSQSGCDSRGYQLRQLTAEEIPVMLPLLHDLSQVRERAITGLSVIMKERARPVIEPYRINARTPSDSYIRLHYHFNTSNELRDRYALFSTDKMRIGRILEDLDALAADAAYRHCGADSLEKIAIVTAAIDRISVLQRLDLNADLIVEARVAWVGKSSMEIRILLSTDDGIESGTVKGEALFVMVAREKNRDHAAAVPSLDVFGPEEVQCFDAGIHNKELRIARARRQELPPTYTESLLIHDLHLARRRSTYNGYECVAMAGLSTSTTVTIHSQDRNKHGKAFGGHLLRVAFESAWNAAFIYCRKRPALLHSDDVHFIVSVPIGSIVSFTSQLVYSDPKLNIALVDVRTHLIDTKSGLESQLTNDFRFLFRLLDETALCESVQNLEPIPFVMPLTYEQSMQWLEGRRRVQELGMPV